MSIAKTTRPHLLTREAAAARIAALEAAARKALNYIENTEGELGITLTSGDALRAALAPEQDK